MEPSRSMASACSQKLQTSDAATNLVLSHAPAAQSTEDITQAIDSGYGTRDTTPTVSQRTNSGVSLLEEKVLGPRGLFGRRPTNMTRFRQRPPRTYRDRYLDLKEIFDEKLALKLALKKRLNVRPLDIGLEVLGHDEHDARPCILVTCNESIRRHIEKFFDQQWIKELLDPNPEYDFPRFDLYIRSIPCRAKAFGPVTVFERKSDLNPSHVVSNGQTIFVQADHGWRQAAIGGFIEVIKNAGDSTVYGVTAGHLISPWDVPDLVSNAGSSENGSLGESGASQDSEDESTEPDFSRDIGLIGLDTLSEHTRLVEETSSFSSGVTLPVASDLVVIGHIQGLGSAFAPASEPALMPAQAQTSSKALDYALISISENPVGNHRLWGQISLPASIDAADEWIGDYRKVLLLNDSATPVSGILELSMSSLLLENRGRFVTTHKLELDEAHKFLDGDSGAWVIDVKTNEVYGHIVAVDLFGRAHVVPLSEVLGDVKKVFEAQDVRLYGSVPKTNIEDPTDATNELLNQAPQASLYASSQQVSMNQDHGYVSRLTPNSPEAKRNPVATIPTRYTEPLWNFPAHATGLASPLELGQSLHTRPSEDEHLKAVNASETTADSTKHETTSGNRDRIGQTNSSDVSQNDSDVKKQQPSLNLEGKEDKKILGASNPDARRRNSSRSEHSRVSLAKRKLNPLDDNDIAPTLIGEGKEEVQQTLIEPTVEFTDARGRVIQFPYETCKKWSGMRALIEKTAMHYEELNSELINGKYDLVQEKGAIVLPTTWDKLVRPNMSIRLRMWSSKDTLYSETPHPRGFSLRVLPEQTQPKSAHAPVEPPAHDLPTRVLSPPVTSYPGIDIHRPSSHSRSDLDSLDSVSVMSRGNLRMALIRLRVAEAREKQANNRAELAEQSLADRIKEVRSLNYTIETHLSISKKLEWEAHQSRQQGEEAKAQHDQQFAKLQARANSVQKHLEREQFEQRRNLNRIVLFTEDPPETSAVVPLSACESWNDLVRLVSRLMRSRLNEDFDEVGFVLIDPRGDVILPDFWPTLVEPGWAIQIVTRPTRVTEAVHDRTPDTTKKGQKSVKENLDSPKVLPSLPGKRQITQNGAETQQTKQAAFSDTGTHLVSTRAHLITRPKIPLALFPFLVYIPLSFVIALLGMHMSFSGTMHYMQLSMIIGSSLAGFALAWLLQSFSTPKQITREQSLSSQ